MEKVCSVYGALIVVRVGVEGTVSLALPSHEIGEFCRYLAAKMFLGSVVSFSHIITHGCSLKLHFSAPLLTK